MLNFKDLEKMSNEELAELDEETIQNIVDIELISQGVALQDEPVLEEIGPDQKETHMYFSDNRFDKLLFPSIDAFEDILKRCDDLGVRKECCISGKKVATDLDFYTWGDKFEKTNPVSGKYFTYEEYLANKDNLKEMEEKRKRNKAKTDNYNLYSDKVAKIRSDIYGLIRDAKFDIADQEDKIVLFAKYYKLAENNFEVAINFFHDTVDNSEDYVDILKKEYNVE